MKVIKIYYVLAFFLIVLVVWWLVNHDISNPESVAVSYAKSIVVSDLRQLAFLESGDPFSFEKNTGGFSLLILAAQRESDKGNLNNYKFDAKVAEKNNLTSRVKLKIEQIDFSISGDKLSRYWLGTSERQEDGTWIKVPPTRPDLSYEAARELARSESPWNSYEFELTLKKVSSGWIIDAEKAKPLWHFFYPDRPEYKP